MKYVAGDMRLNLLYVLFIFANHLALSRNKIWVFHNKEKKPTTNSQQQLQQQHQSFLWLINSVRPQSVEFRSFRSIKAEVCSSLCWLVGHKESFLCVQRQNACSVCHLQLRKKSIDSFEQCSLIEIRPNLSNTAR